MKHVSVLFLIVAALVSTPVLSQTASNITCSDVKMAYSTGGMSYLKQIARTFHVTGKQKKMALACLHQDTKIAKQR